MDDLTLKARLQANDDLQKIMTGTGRITDLVPGVANRRYGKQEVKDMKADRRLANEGLKEANAEQKRIDREQRQADNRQALTERTASNPKLTAITDPSKTPQGMSAQQAATHNLKQEAETLNQIESRRPQLRPIQPMGGGPAAPSGPAIPAGAPNAQQAAAMGLTNAPAPAAPAPAAPAPAAPAAPASASGTGTAPNPVPLPASSPSTNVPLPPPAPAAPAPAAPAAPAPAAPAPAAPAPPAQQGQQPAQQGQTAAPAKTQDPAYLAQVAEATKRAGTKGGLATNPMFAALTGGVGNIAAAGWNAYQRSQGRKDLERLRTTKSVEHDSLYDMLTIRKAIQERNTTEVLRSGLR